MDKLKNLLNPGSKHDDEILYGSGSSSDPVHSGKAEDVHEAGSHFASARDTTDVKRSLAKSGIASETPASVDVKGGNLDEGQTHTDTSVTRHSDLVGGPGGVGGIAAAAEHLRGSNAGLQSGYDSARSRDPSSYASTHTASRGEGPAHSHVTQPGPVMESTDNSAAGPALGATGSSIGHDATIDGAGLATDGRAPHHEPQRVPEIQDLTGRTFPLGGANAPMSDIGSQPEVFQQHRETADNPTGSLTSAESANPHLGIPSAQDFESNRGEDVVNNAELGSYGPESWQHEHNKHGHEFVPVKQHETLMGALLDPHSSSGVKDSRREPQAKLKGEAAVSGAALVGAGAAWERSQDHSAPSGDIPSTTVNTDDVHRRSGLNTEPTPIIAARPAVGNPIKPNEQGDSRASNSASESADVSLSGPVHKSSILNKLDPRVKETSPSASNNASVSQPTTSASQSSSSPYGASQVDPRVDSASRKDTTTTEHHVGRDAAAVGALGGTALAGADYAKGKEHEKSRSKHEAPIPVQNRGFMGVGDSGFDHERAELDPQRTSLAPPSAATQALRGTSEPQAGPRFTTEHKYGRDDAAITGAGAVAGKGIGAHHIQAVSSSSTQPTNQPCNVGSDHEPQHHYTRDAALVGTGAGVVEGVRHHHNQPEPTREARFTDFASGEGSNLDQDYGRDATVVGTGALAAEEIRQREETPQAEFSKQEAERASKQDAEHAKALEKEEEKKAKALEKEEEKKAKTLEKEHKKEEKAIAAEHKKEDKALAQQQKEEAKHEKAVAKEQKEHEKETKELEKQHKQEEKALAKEEKENAKHEKELAAAAAAAEKEYADHDEEPADRTNSKKEDKRHEKLHAALERAERREEKQFEKAQKEHEKENADAHGEKKHKGILGLFHRDKKSSKEAEEEDLENRGHSSFGLTGAKPAEAGVVAPSAYEMTEHEKQQHEKHERNRLHKDPPASLLPTAGNTAYAEPPKSGYAAQVTGGTGTTALAQGDGFNRGSHISALGNKLDPAVDESGLTTNNEQNTIIDSDTGLPVDLSKGPHGNGTDDTPVPQEGGFPSGQASRVAEEEIGTAK